MSHSLLSKWFGLAIRNEWVFLFLMGSTMAGLSFLIDYLIEVLQGNESWHAQNNRGLIISDASWRTNALLICFLCQLLLDISTCMKFLTKKINLRKCASTITLAPCKISVITLNQRRTMCFISRRTFPFSFAIWSGWDLQHCWSRGRCRLRVGLRPPLPDRAFRRWKPSYGRHLSTKSTSNGRFWSPNCLASFLRSALDYRVRIFES